MKAEKESMKEIVKYLFEAGQLSEIRRGGDLLLGIDNPQTVAEHSFRAGVVGYFIGKLEGVNAEKAAVIALFNDMHESRIGDLHKIAQRYVNQKKAEKNAFEEQVEKFPEEIKKEMLDNLHNLQNDGTPEGIVARDADLIENAIQYKEYIENGHKEAQEWLDNVRRLVKTKTARQMMDTIQKTDSRSWWKGLKKIER